MVNQATLLGRVGKIDSKVTSSGVKITNLSLVTSKKFVKNGEKQEKVTWHNITIFSNLADIAEKYIKVGDVIFLQGEIQNQKYTAQDGSEKMKNYIIAHDIKLLPKSKEHKPEPKADPSFSSDFQDDDLPF